MSISSEHSSRPTDQPASDLDDETSEHCTDQSSVNRAILQSLNRLNENFASLTQHSYPDEFAESEAAPAEGHADNPANIDIQADIDNLLQTGDNPVVDKSLEGATSNANETEIR